MTCPPETSTLLSVMKQTHYLVKTPGECTQTKHFVTLKGAQKFIEKDLEAFYEWYDDEEEGGEREEALRLIKMMKPVPFEVDVPEYI